MEFIITKAQREEMGAVDEKFFQASIGNAGMDDGVRIKVQSPAVHALFQKLAKKKTQGYNMGKNGEWLVWNLNLPIPGADLLTGGDDLYTGNGTMNMAFLRSTKLDEGVEFVFPGPFTEEDQERLRQVLETAARYLFQRYMRQTQREFIIFGREAQKE